MKSPNRSPLLSVVTFSMLCTGIFGCGNQRTASTKLVEVGRIEWNSPAEASVTLGIEEASVTHLRYGDHHIVLWIDIAMANHESGGSARYLSGLEESIDGRRAEWKCEIVDNTCRVTIGRKSFDIENGNLFLVSTSSGEPHTLQIRHDTARITYSEEFLRKLARTNHQIRGFYNYDSKAE